MPVVHPVFDTNIYRKLDRATAVELRAAERSQSVQPLAGFYPTLELAAHLGDPSDKAFKASLRGFSAIAAHTSVYDGSRPVVPFLGNIEAQLGWRFLRRRLPEERDQAESFGYLLGEIAQTDPVRVPQHLAALFRIMKALVAEREAKFSDDMLGMVRYLDPESSGWHPHRTDAAERARLMAKLRDPTFLRASAVARVGAVEAWWEETFTPESRSIATDLILAAFPTAHVFMRNLMIGMIESGTDFSRSEKANSAWDITLSYIVSPNARVNGVPCIFVTDERRFHTAAGGTGHECFCLNFKDYVALLESGSMWDYVGAFPPPVA